MAKFYAVRKGRTVGIFTDWATTSASVTGFPGAIFKSFPSHEEALAFLQAAPVAPVTPATPAAPVIPTAPENPILVYTDGSCIDQVAGYGFIVIDGETATGYYGPLPTRPSTNQKAELYAIIQALHQTPADRPLLIRTDSKYSINSLTVWYQNWLRNGWRTSTGKPVENRDFIEEALGLMQGRSVQFEHVYGHTGDTYNEMADTLANKGRAL